MTSEPFPFYQLSARSRFEATERLGLGQGDRRNALRRAVLYAIAVYLPFLLTALAGRFWTGTWDPRFAAIDTHVRALVALPLLLIAEPIVDSRARAASRYLVQAGIVPEEQQERYRDIAGRIGRLRDSRLVEGITLAAVVLASALGVVPPAGMAAPIPGMGTFLIVTLFRFVLLRWLWSWILWAVFLFRVSRLPLVLNATHADRMGGLAPLLDPSEAFALVAAGGGAAIAASWANYVVHGGVPVETFRPAAILYVVIMALAAAAPLWSFCGPLARAREDALCYYGALVQRFESAFRAWSQNEGASPELEAPEISVWADVGAGYERSAKAQFVPWSIRMLLSVALGGALPFLVVMLLEGRVPEVLVGLLKALT